MGSTAMNIRDVLGLYGPNKPVWPLEVYEQIHRSRVSWVLWRTDADEHAPKVLASMGLRVLAQAPDAFNSNPYIEPAAECENLYADVSQFCPTGTPVAFDNEPNLHPLKAGTWYAEQWTRYARAYMAYWRYLDPGRQYPLILPALAVGPDRNGRLWHDTQLENLDEADGVGLHAFWQQATQINEADFGAPWKLIPGQHIVPDFHVLEYANTLPGLTHADTRDQYEAFLRGLPVGVRCACLFGLGLTDDWDRFRITPAVLDWLASLE